MTEDVSTLKPKKSEGITHRTIEALITLWIVDSVIVAIIFVNLHLNLKVSYVNLDLVSARLIERNVDLDRTASLSILTLAL